MRIYLASNYQSHPKMRMVRSLLQKDGHIVTSRWINGKPEANDDPSESHRRAQEDWDDLRDSDVCIWFSVGQSPRQRGGRHVEFGLALAWNIPIHVIGSKENVFHYLPQITHHEDLETAMGFLKR